MSVDKSGVIDIISTTVEGKVALTISDHLSWEDDHHLQLLEDKINGYLAFIEGGQIYEDYPDAINRELSIRTVMKYEPSTEAIDFLEKCREIICDTGIGFEWHLFNDE
jgi:hypothetical protein